MRAFLRRVEVYRVLWLVCAALLAPNAARADELVGSFGHWGVLRSEPGTNHCNMMTKSADGLLRLGFQPTVQGALIVIVGVTSGPSEPRRPDDQVGFGWQPRGSGQLKLVTYPIVGSQVLPGPPARLFLHTVLRQPEEVAVLLTAATASAGVVIYLDPGYEGVLPTAGFSEAWAALRACDPLTPPLPN